MKKINCLFVLFFILLTRVYAQQGKNGVETVSTVNTIVNEYTALTADAHAGNTSITVSSSSLNSHSRFSQSLSAGDLIMIIQMQGATISSNVTDSTWGTVTNYNNCGLYEFSEVASAPTGTTININCALRNSYSASGNTQIVRVPRFTSLTVNTGDTLTCDTWNGSTGGIVVTEVMNNTVINTGGVINATGKGFRGGVLQNASTITNVQTYANSTSEDSGSQKGEGIAGFETAYNIYGGMYGRGAAANGGGGGNSWNAGGGGGANAGNTSAWNGNGNPDTSNSSWVAAWNLEYNGFASSTSSGGGRGGYCWSGADENPLTDPPGNSSWGGDSRNNHGGKGGRPLDYSTGRIFMGGGGGAGNEDNDNGSGGANGGGIVYLLCYGTTGGSGYVLSNGNIPSNSTGDYSANGDAPGGGGAGGTIILYSTGAISGITAIANGGVGGSQVVPGGSEAEGAGGGGGGGYIATSNGSIMQQAMGGVNGTTNSPAVSAFPPNGGTKGGNGMANQVISTIPFSSVLTNVSPGATICSGGVTTLTASGGATYLWSPAQGLNCDTCSNPIANPLVTTTYSVTVSSGTCTGTDSVVVTVLNASAGVISSLPNPVCQGDDVTLLSTGNSGSIQWQYSTTGNNFNSIPGADSAVYFAQSPATTYYRVLADSGSCFDTSQSYKLVVNPLPVPPVLNTTDSAVCSPDSVLINASGNYASYTWNDGDTTGFTYAHSTGEYWVTVTDVGGCTAVSGQQGVTIFPQPVPPALSTNDSIICASDSTLITTSGSYSSYLWNNGDTRSFTYANAAGGYWVTVSDANGCTAVSGHRDISVYPVPSVSVVEQGEALSSFGASSYQWYFNGDSIPNANAPYCIAAQTGNYSLQITDTNGCTAVSNNIFITVTGIVQPGAPNELDIYPNPFTDIISIRNDGDAPIVEIEVTDVLGRTVINKRIQDATSDLLTVDVTGIAAGTYYIKIEKANVAFVEKIIKLSFK